MQTLLGTLHERHAKSHCAGAPSRAIAQRSRPPDGVAVGRPRAGLAAGRPSCQSALLPADTASCLETEPSVRACLNVATACACHEHACCGPARQKQLLPGCPLQPALAGAVAAGVAALPAAPAVPADGMALLEVCGGLQGVGSEVTCMYNGRVVSTAASSPSGCRRRCHLSADLSKAARRPVLGLLAIYGGVCCGAWEATWRTSVSVSPWVHAGYVANTLSNQAALLSVRTLGGAHRDRRHVTKHS